MASSPDPGNCLVPEEEEIQGAIERLTSTEKDIINEVLLRDEEIRAQEKQRLSDLKREFDELVELGVPEGKEKEYGRCCARCRSPLGLLSNKGALCPWCKKKVCKNCEKPIGESWICTLCFKDREIKGETGEWFYGSLAKKKKTPYGSTLLKKLIKRRKSQAYKLSKSRLRSEEESFEIEYAIADTFRQSTAEKSDREYVVVDKEADGNISVSEVSCDFEVAQANGQITTSERKEESSEVDVNSVFEEYEREENLKDQLPAESYESLGSIHSNTDVYESLRPQVKVAGEILLGFKYDETKQHFEVQIHKAKGLVAADTRKNTSDPYVKTYLLQDKTRSNKKKTKVKKHTLDPVFDDILVHKISYEDLIQKTLSVSVWHNDMLGQNVFLGEVQIDLQEYIASGYSLSDPLPQLYQLAEKRVTRESLKNVGEIVLEIMYIPPGSGDPQKKVKTNSDPVSGQLLVKCIEGKNLSGTESSNPFCKVILLPVKTKNKEPQYKTEVEARTLNPYWDQEFIFENVTFNELSSKVLQVSVHDASVGSKDSFMGAVRLGSGTSEEPFDDPNIKESVAWQKMLQEPNKRISSILALRSTLESLKSCASLAPVLVEREEDTKYQRKKSDSILSQTSTASMEDTSSIKTASLPFKGRLKPQPDLYSLQSFGSMLSIYSDAGGYGSVPISGEMLFSIQYDNMSGVFEIHVQKAKNIAAVNKKTRASDPYVKTYLLPDKSKDSKKKTNFKRKTVNPNWDEKIKYKIGEKDLMKRTLQVSIWNHEKFGHNDFLGEVQVQIAQYVKSGHNLSAHEPIWYTLQELAPVSVGAPGYKGAITVGLKFERIDDAVGKLLVDVKEAKDLAAADPNQLSNPFVKSYLLPDRTRKSKRKSTFKKGTLSPQWNEKFEYNGVTLEELEQRVLELTVWDHDLHSNDFLGGTRVGLERGDENWHDCIGKEVSIWNAMLEHPGIWVEYSIPLRDSMTSRKGMDLNPPNVEIETTAEREPEYEPEPAPAPRVIIQHQPDAPVTKTGDGVSSTFNISHEDPLVRLGLMYVSPEEKSKKKGSLKVLVKGARNLPVSTGTESPNTYCKCYIRPKRSSWRFRTDIFKRSTEPMWEKEFEFDGIAMEELSTKCLDVIVFDDSNLGIGMVRLGPGLMQTAWDDSTDREIEIWKAMMENPDSWNNLMIPLRMEIDEASTTYTGYEDREVEDVPLEVNAVETNSKPQEREPLSAKDLALQSMGSHATKIKDIMRTNGATDDDNTKSGMKARTRSQDDLLRPLSLIVEEGDGEEHSRVRFQGDKVGSARSVPRVVVTKDDEMPPQIVPEDADVDIGEADFASNLTKMSRFGSRDSIVSQTSIYSTASNSVFGVIPVRGEIQFGMKYMMGTNTFEVHIFRAKEIAAVDARKNTSDPYVKVYLLPDKTKASKKKTKVKHKTLNPEWNAIIEYKVSITDLRTRTLMVSIWNNDRLGRNYFLGEVMLPLDRIVDDGVLSKPNTAWYPVKEKSTLSSPIIYKGDLTIGLMYENFSASEGTDVRKGGKDKKEKKHKKDKKKKEGGRIHVHVIKANDLPSADDDGFCDPFCKFYLLPLKQAKTKRKTPVIKKARSAYWDYKTEYDADYDDLSDLGIEFTVYDWDQKSRNDFLGCCRLNLGGQNANWDDAHGAEGDAWLKMINEPNKLHEFVIPLRSSSDPRPRVDY
eukprot:Seg60.3 transcript_id=Seg60.3/GoldUCD/mRNA.D3Y31 product="Synaptotagmin-like protein 4" protein_id=Seg60.3/GoldUCD/D3Y31